MRTGNRRSDSTGVSIDKAGGRVAVIYRPIAELNLDPNNPRLHNGRFETARLVHTATRLNDGEVLIAAGENQRGGADLERAELFDPKTREFTATASLHFPRLFHIATMLPSGHGADRWGNQQRHGRSQCPELFLP